MKRVAIFSSLLFSFVAMAKPACNIDGVPPTNGLVGVISGSATGFIPKEPVYITVTNNGLNYTSMIDRDGKYAVVYGDIAANTEVLCWQGWGEERIEVKGTVTP